jgi:hypothetical protein
MPPPRRAPRTQRTTTAARPASAAAAFVLDRTPSVPFCGRSQDQGPGPEGAGRRGGGGPHGGRPRQAPLQHRRPRQACQDECVPDCASPFSLSLANLK